MGSVVPMVSPCPLPCNRTWCQGAALEQRRRKGLLLFPQPLPIQELGSGSGYPLWGCWRTRTTAFPHCRHSCRDLSLSCGRTGGTRVSRSSEQLEPSSPPRWSWASPAPCTVPQPSWGQAGPPEGRPRVCHRTHPAMSTGPQQPHCQGRGCGDEGAAFPVPIPSLSPSLPRAGLADRPRASAKSRMPQEDGSPSPACSPASAPKTGCS